MHRLLSRPGLWQQDLLLIYFSQRFWQVPSAQFTSFLYCGVIGDSAINVATRGRKLCNGDPLLSIFRPQAMYVCSSSSKGPALWLFVMECKISPSEGKVPYLHNVACFFHMVHDTSVFVLLLCVTSQCWFWCVPRTNDGPMCTIQCHVRRIGRWFSRLHWSRH